MNWLDILLGILIFGSVVAGLTKGFARAGVGFVSTIAGLVCGLWFYGIAGSFLVPYVSSKGIANCIGFFLVFCGILLLGALFGRLLAMVFKWAGLSWLDRILGAAFGLLRGAIFAAVVVMAVLAFSPEPPPRSVVHSKIAPYVIDAARVMVAMAPRELKDGFHKSYEKVREIWSEAMKKGIHDITREGGSTL